MRGLKTTIGLLVVLGGLGAYIYFVTWKQPAEDTSASKLEKVFAGLQSDKVDEIRVNSESGDSTLLKKDKDGWHITEPVAATAQDSEATGIASALSQLEVARVIDENPASLVDYGLGAPRLEIDFKGPGDKTYKKLLIGQKSPTGANLFAKRNDEKRVFAIAAFQEATLNRSTFDLRDKTVIKFDREKVDHVDVIHLLAVELDHRLVAQVERRAVERRFLERGNREDALLVIPLGEEVRSGGRLLADQKLLVGLVARAFEVDLEARRTEAVVHEARRVFVDDARDFELRQRGRDAGGFRILRGRGDGLGDVPAVFVFLEQRRVARLGVDADLIDLVRLQAGEHLLELRRGRVFSRLLPRDKVDVRAQPAEHDEQSCLLYTSPS